MIDGLRVLPWWQEERRRAARSGFDSLKDCKTCMTTNTEQTRMLMGCGWMPPAPVQLRRFVRPPEPGHYVPEERDEQYCPGYLVQLPEVVEVARARFWKHDLRSFCGGEIPTDALMRGIEILESANAEMDYARMTPADKGGWAEG